jgi:hypothetical protein
VLPVMLTELVTWITLILAGCGLNGTVVTAFLICSIAIGGAIFSDSAARHAV